MRMVCLPRLTLVFHGDEQGCGLRPSSLQEKLARSVERKRTLARFRRLAASGATSRIVFGALRVGRGAGGIGQRKAEPARFQWVSR